jgi:hypothetical protein
MTIECNVFSVDRGLGVGKYVTNGSKTASMDVIGFLCVSLGSSTVQLHVQRLVSAAKFATVLEVCTTEEQRSVVRFLWAKGLNAKYIHKEMFSVYGGKCLSRKAVHNWVAKRGKRFADGEEVQSDVQKWLRHQPKDFYAASFDALVKRWDKTKRFNRMCRGG